MKSKVLLKQLAAVFVAALAVYVIAYTGIERRRARNGPWRLAFTNDASGAPAVLINQPKLGITNVLIIFPGETMPAQTNATALLAPEQPLPVPFATPFGQCVFLDLTSLPGTIVLELFGHEIQLLPRVLTIDKAEQPWRSGARLPLEPVLHRN